MHAHRQESVSISVFFAHRSAVRVVVALTVSLLFVLSTRASGGEDVKTVSKSLSQEIEQAQFLKIYVADFLDPSGARTEKGCFFASTFSTNLAKDAHNFEVINRIQAQRKLNELQISQQDFQQTELLTKVAQALGADAILLGSMVISHDDVTIALTLRDVASGREVRSTKFHEQVKPAFEIINFPAAEDPISHVYYFPGLDGVSQPKCKRCPDPDYTDEARRKKIQGTVLMSVLLDGKGTVIDARVVKSADESLARKSVDVLKKWRFEPCHDPEGRPVPCRVIIETMFKLLN